jgi:protein-S-isoprenylcysteine O-methyltransferase Ste14
MLPNYHLDLATPGAVLWLAVNVVVMACTLAVLLAVLVDFMKFQNRPGIKRRTKSIVETGSMMGFFLLYYCLVRFGIGQLDWPFSAATIALASVGCLLLIVGAAVNVRGRLRLGKNWANQVVIYKDQTLITDDVYGLVRHPLYASLIWMFFGASLVYGNYAASAATAAIFLPFMAYRARQEERSLVDEFKEYRDYQGRVGMFFPKFTAHQ